ncbi:MAG: hypothetical protein H8E34_10630 [Bacteroidetes bacterium]|nr:hypothetical protein [Bacteroidota bacterium]MBL6944255.1 hypothetical protein [Bacteroidales bacterium]
MKLLSNNREIYFILALGFIAGVIVIFFTNISYGGGDSIQHYNLAHWGWEHPKLLFNHWGKPVFTILMSPWAQFGINGARIYNLFMGFATTIIIWKIAKTLNLSNSWVSIFLVLFTPIYLILMLTPLTEVSFSFFLALSILLFFKKKYIYSSIVLSFLPLIRTEGIVLLPLFVTAYILRKKILAIPFLLSGYLIISALGYPYYHDFLWLITKMPYTGSAKDIYENGSLFHFIYNTIDERAILGKILSTLFILGLLLSLIRWGKNDKFKLSETFYFLLLVPGSYLVFFSAHSFVWWQGMGNSLGLLRVIGSVTPLAALTALCGINYITGYINKKSKIISSLIISVIVLLIFLFGVKDYKGSFNLSRPQQLLTQSTEFIKENNLLEHQIYYFDPYVVFELGIDPYDKTKGYWGVPNVENPSLGIPDSSIIIWDAHFGPNEGRVNLESLQKQKSLKTIEIFKPETPFTVLGGHNYEVHIFMKDIKLNDELTTIFSFDFETSKISSADISHTGIKSLYVTSKISYIVGIDSYLYDMISSLGRFSVSASGYIFIEKVINAELPIVCALEDNNGTNYYKAYDLRNQITNVGEWNYFEHNFIVNNVISLNELLKVYIWNKHKQDFYLDDFEMNIETFPSPSLQSEILN